MRRRWRRLRLVDQVIIGCLIGVTTSAVLCFGTALVVEIVNEMK